MKTLIRKILIGMILAQGSLSGAQAALLPMRDKLLFAQIALLTQLEPQGLQLIKVDIKTPLENDGVISKVLKAVESVYKSQPTTELEYVRFKARDLTTEKIYVGWVYLQSQNITHMSDDEIRKGWAGAGYSQSLTRVIKTDTQQKIWIFLSDNANDRGPLPRFGDNDLHLVEAGILP